MFSFRRVFVNTIVYFSCDVNSKKKFGFFFRIHKTNIIKIHNNIRLHVQWWRGISSRALSVLFKTVRFPFTSPRSISTNNENNTDTYNIIYILFIISLCLIIERVYMCFVYVSYTIIIYCGIIRLF